MKSSVGFLHNEVFSLITMIKVYMLITRDRKTVIFGDKKKWFSVDQKLQIKVISQVLFAMI